MSYLPAPVKAELGQCYRLAYLAPRLSAEPQTVVVQDAADQIVVTEPKFVADTVSVIVDYHLPQAESEAVEMQMHERKIVVRPEYRTWEVQPARFDEVADPILLAPAHKNFKSCGVDDGSLERHWCVENVAATYQSVSRRTVTRLADVIEKRVPAEERVLRVRQPVNSDDRSRLQPVMEVIEVQRLSVPASYRREVLLPEFKTVTVRQLTRPAALSWRQVLCEGSVAKPLVALVQEALNERGYDVGEPDGAMGEKTLAAIAQFRLDKMWPDLGRDISLELLSALQIALPQ